MKVKAVRAPGIDWIEKQAIPFKKPNRFEKPNPSFYEQSFTCAGKSTENGQPCQAKAKAHEKHCRGEKQIIVSGYFYLAPGEKHTPQCDMDPLTRGHQVRTRYCDLITYQNHTFTLVIPEHQTWMQVRETAEAEPGDSGNDNGSEATERTKLTGKQRSISHYILMAAKEIAEILKDHHDDDKARALFNIRYKGQIIAWDSFFFDTREGSSKLYRRAKKNLKDKNSTPIVVYGRVGTITKASPGKDNHKIWIKNSTRETTPAGKIISINIFTPSPDILTYQVDDLVLGFGFWEPWKEQPHQLRIFATAEQVTQIDGL